MPSGAVSPCRFIDRSMPEKSKSLEMIRKKLILLPFDKRSHADCNANVVRAASGHVAVGKGR